MSAALGRDRTCEEFVPDPDPEPAYGPRCLRCGAFEEQHLRPKRLRTSDTAACVPVAEVSD